MRPFVFMRPDGNAFLLLKITTTMQENLFVLEANGGRRRQRRWLPCEELIRQRKLSLEDCRMKFATMTKKHLRFE